MGKWDQYAVEDTPPTTTDKWAQYAMPEQGGAPAPPAPRQSVWDRIGEMSAPGLLGPLGLAKMKEIPRVLADAGSAVTLGIVKPDDLLPFSKNSMGNRIGAQVAAQHGQSFTPAGIDYSPIESGGGRIADVLGNILGITAGPAGAAGKLAAGGVAGKLGAEAASSILGKVAVRGAEGAVVGGMSNINDSPQNILMRTLIGAGANPLVGATLDAGGAIVRGGAKVLGRIFGVPGGATERVLERGAGNVLKPELEESIQPVAEKVQNSVNEYRQISNQEYAAAKKVFQPQLERGTVKLADIANGWKQELTEAGILTEDAKLLDPILGKEITGPEAREAKETLKQVFDKLHSLSGDALGNVNAWKAQRIVDELDEMLEYNPNKVKPLNNTAEYLLKSLRHNLAETIQKVVPDFGNAQAARSEFYSIYNAARRRLADPNIESTLNGLLNPRNSFNLRTLSKIDAKLPPEHQFMNEVKDAIAGRMLQREPTGGALRLVDPSTYITPKMFARTGIPLLRPVVNAAQAVGGLNPAVPSTVAALMNQLGLRDEDGQFPEGK